MSDGLLQSLVRRFPAVADPLPRAFGALAGDDSIPFLVRYRRDALAGLDEAMLRRLRAAIREEREYDRRRRAAKKGLAAASVLSEELSAKIDQSRDSVWLEDLLRPWRKDRATATDPMLPTARAVLLGESTEALDVLLLPFCGADGAPPTTADQRARVVRLVADLIGDDADLRAAVRAVVRKHGEVVADVTKDHQSAPTWKPFQGLRTPLADLKARLALTMRRGQKLGAVSVKIELAEEHRTALLAGPLAVKEGHPHAELLATASAEALTRILVPAAGSELLRERRRQAERAILPRIAEALEARLLASPAGAVPVVAVVPGSGASARITVVLPNGRAKATIAVHPFAPSPDNERLAAGTTLLDLVKENGVKLVAVAGSRKARACRDWVASVLAGARDLAAVPVPVHEAPAAGFAESDAGKLDAPELPATARVALSLARLVQDPLCEAARYNLTELQLDPHQRDVDQGELRRLFDEVMSDCVAVVGADVNTAPAAFLARVPGLDTATAEAIVASREKDGAFATRGDVKRAISEEVWQRASGFLRVKDGVDALDRTGVHPQAAPIAASIAAAKGVELSALIGNRDALAGLDLAPFVTTAHTEGDVDSVVRLLAIGSADPRAQYAAPAFNPGLERLNDAAVGAELDGVVTGLSKFGAFVDVGLRQLGLVHVSEISHAYVQDPAQAVSVGQRVRVKVLAVDPAKRRISLSMKALLPVPERAPEEERSRRPRGEFVGAGAGGEGFGGGGQPRGPRGGSDRPQRGPSGPSRGPAGPGGPGSGAGSAPGASRPFGGRGPGRTGERSAPERPAGPERPGTAPRRAAKFGRKPGGGAGGMFGATAGNNGDLRRTSKGAPRPAGEDEGPSKNFKPLPKPVDPFVAQLSMLKGQLGIGGGGRRAPETVAPSAAADTTSDEGLSSEERRQKRRAQARAEAAARAAAAPVVEPVGERSQGDGVSASDEAASEAPTIDVSAETLAQASQRLSEPNEAQENERTTAYISPDEMARELKRRGIDTGVPASERTTAYLPPEAMAKELPKDGQAAGEEGTEPSA